MQKKRIRRIKDIKLQKQKIFSFLCNKLSFMIRVTDLHKTYCTGQNYLHVLKGINISISRGEMVSIMGSSGSGKSTLLNVIGILDKYDTGRFELGDLFINNLDEKIASKYRNKYIGFVFQSFNLIAYKNAMENVALPLYYQKVKEKERNKRALEMLDRVGLKEWWHHKPNELSGGQKQRVAIARALITNPSLMLADEPTGALDSQTSSEIIMLLREINQKEKITMIIVTHEQDIAKLTDRIIQLKDGVVEN